MARDDDRFFFFLDSPKYQRVEIGNSNRFAGVVFDSLNTPVTSIRASFDGKGSGTFPVDMPSEDVARHLPGLSSAKRCRFEFDLLIPEAAGSLTLEAIDNRDRPRALLEYDLDRVRASGDVLRSMSDALRGGEIPSPPPPIVFLTQGHSDSFAYQESIIPGIFNQRRYLKASGAGMSDVRSVLDLGCGSGRSLVGWYLDDPTRELVGCDINSELIGWAKSNLPRALRFDRTDFEPPLPYRDGSFDLVNVISVFTHMGLPAQQRWAEEVHRILRPGGIAFLSVHGLPYVHLSSPGRLDEFERDGRFEIETGPEGSNSRAAFHSPAAIRRLFPDFDPIGEFPAGRIDGKRILFPIAAFQDVYVLRK